MVKLPNGALEPETCFILNENFDLVHKKHRFRLCEADDIAMGTVRTPCEALLVQGRAMYKENIHTTKIWRVLRDRCRREFGIPMFSKETLRKALEPNWTDRMLDASNTANWIMQQNNGRGYGSINDQRSCLDGIFWVPDTHDLSKFAAGRSRYELCLQVCPYMIPLIPLQPSLLLLSFPLLCW